MHRAIFWTLERFADIQWLLFTLLPELLSIKERESSSSQVPTTIYDIAAMLVQNKFLSSKIPDGHIGMKLELTLLSSQQSIVEEFKYFDKSHFPTPGIKT